MASCEVPLHLSAKWQSEACNQFLPPSDGDHFFSVELSRTAPAASFLLEEWMSRVGASLSPYPFILSSYPGDMLGKMQGFVAFLETQLRTGAIEKVLVGVDWLDIPCDWGSLR